MSNFTLIGKYERMYADRNTGETRKYRELMCVWDESYTEKGLLGQKVEAMRWNNDISEQQWISLEIGERYEPTYSYRNTSNGLMARLSGLKVSE